MVELTDKEFESIVADAIDAIPEKYAEHINNVGFVIEDDPSPEQRLKLQLRNDQSLYGLYEGIPLTRRGGNYNLVLPDKITIFKNPSLRMANTVPEVIAQVKKTVWHEVAHYYGLDHPRIHELENKKHKRQK